jgi:hypothetical protein
VILYFFWVVLLLVAPAVTSFQFRVPSFANLSLRSAKLSGGKSSSVFDSHTLLDKIPESLVKSIEGNDGMRRKFEQLVRRAQVSSELHRVYFFHSSVNCHK